MINYGGKIYNTIQIGDQWWLRENLQIGIMIPGNRDATDNGVIEKYCFNNDSVNYRNYGAYYQWNEAMQYSTIPGARGICPEGWHIPTNEEFQKLCDFV